MRLSIPLIAAAAALCGLAFGEPARPPRPPDPSPQSSPARASPDLVDSDLEAIRDIFRFGDDLDTSRRSEVAAPARSEVTPSEPPPVPGTRLIGLVRRPDGLQAALALEGEVVLLGADESALGYTVLDVSEDRVIVRDPGGKELTLGVGPG